MICLTKTMSPGPVHTSASDPRLFNCTHGCKRCVPCTDRASAHAIVADWSKNPPLEAHSKWGDERKCRVPSYAGICARQAQLSRSALVKDWMWSNHRLKFGIS